MKFSTQKPLSKRAKFSLKKIPRKFKYFTTKNRQNNCDFVWIVKLDSLRQPEPKRVKFYQNLNLIASQKFPWNLKRLRKLCMTPDFFFRIWIVWRFLHVFSLLCFNGFWNAFFSSMPRKYACWGECLEILGFFFEKIGFSRIFNYFSKGISMIFTNSYIFFLRL
jgi:hypothetical protein